MKACKHCNLEFNEDMMIEENHNYFCCNGCLGVYNLLNSNGLEGFYDKLGDNKLEPKTTDTQNLEKFDLDGFKNKYVKIDEDGLSNISLIIEGIHCSACVWLNEKVLHKLDGIIEAEINYTTNKAKIVYDSDVLKLSTIIETISSIGYKAYPYDASLQEERAMKRRKDYYTRILVAIFGAMNIMWLAVAHYAGYFSGIQQSFKTILNWAEFVLATPVLFYSGWIFFRGAYYGYKNKIVNMDTLVASGALSAYIYSIYATISEVGEVYFDSVVMIITFVLVGKYLEVLSKKRAVDTIDSLISSTPTEVLLIKDNVKSLVSIENIEIGDIIEIKAGERVVIDGEIISGGGLFDESSLTGESEPIYRENEIISGSICLDTLIRYKATKTSSNSMLTSIINLLEESITKKPYIEKLANSISGYFSTTILLLSIFTFIGWFFYTDNFEQSLIIAISVVVIACPCALGLATPMATLIGISMSAKRGILFKEASFLETMAKATVLALDKTGTITKGKPSVEDIEIYDEFDISLLYSLVSSSIHPISKGIKDYILNNYQNLKELELEDIKQIEAKGVKAKYKDMTLIGGNGDLLDIDLDITSNNSLFYFSIDGKLKVKIELKDQIKDNTKEIISKFKKMGIRVIMLTGDRDKSAKYVAKSVGIDEVHSTLLPQDKANIIDKLHSDGEIVVMVGDGINDSLALSYSDISISMGSGADVAIDVSDVVLLDDRVESIYDAFLLSKRTYSAIKENLTLSILYNVISVPLAIMGFVNPLIASLSMSLSSLIVVVNSMRIKRIKF